MRPALLVVAGLVVLAGCGAPPGGRTALAATGAPSATPPATAAPSADRVAPAVSYVRADLAQGERLGVAAGGGGLVLGGSALTSGTYTDPHGAGALAFESGSWTSAWNATPFAFDELIASWAAATPAGTWVKIESQARGAGRETKWYVLGVWASGDGDIRRTTQRQQQDADGTVEVDTFIRRGGLLDGYRLRATLHRRAGSGATPTLRALSAMVSKKATYAIPSPWSGAAVDLAVPALSQETHTGHYPEYDGGGEAWCSPTSTAMVLRFLGSGPGGVDLAAFPGIAHTDGAVDHAARYTYDWSYRGAGNWAFNTAHAATYGLDAFVTRLRSLDEARLFLQAGIPLIASIKGELPGFLFGKTNGHLLVIRGLTASGDVVTNDPAVLTNDAARKVYARRDFETVWLEGSGGVVYVIRSGHLPLPANVPGAPPNW